MSRDQADPNTARWMPIGVFLLALAVFAPALQVGFVLDDSGQVLMNGAVERFDLGQIFGRGYWANVDEGGLSFAAGGELYRPLTTLSVALSYQLYGESPFGYHVENVLFHALASVLVGFAAGAWGLRPAVSWSAALLFAVAPVHIEPVASVILRNELLAAIFGLAFLWSHARGRSVLAAVWLLAALLCKESAIALPFVALAADRVFGARPAPSRTGRHLPWIGAVVLFIALRTAVIGIVTLESEGAYFGDAPWLTVWLTMARFGFEHYASAALFGTPLVFDYYKESYPHAHADDPIAWVALALWVAIGLGTLYALVRHRARWAFPCVAFLLLVGPTANVVTRIGVLGATRLLYLPHLGVALGLGMLYAAALRRARSTPTRVAAHALLGLLAVGYGMQTLRRLQPWTHELTLYEDIVAHAPRNALALGFLGSLEFQTAIDPANHPPPEHLADAKPVTVLERSFEHLTTALAVEPKYWSRLLRALSRTAVLLGREGEFLVALDAALRASGEPVPDAPAPPRFARTIDGPLTAAEGAWLDAFAAATSALRMTDEQVRRYAAARDPQLAVFQRMLVHELALSFAPLFRIQAALPSVNERLRRLRAGTLPAAERPALRADVDAILVAAQRLDQVLEQGMERHPHPLARTFVAKIHGEEYRRRARFWIQRFTRERESL